MSSHKKNLTFALTVALGSLLVLAIGLAWAAPLADGPIYLPLVPKQPTFTPTATPTPTRTPTPTPTRTATPVITNPIVNPGFEQGQTGWVFQSNGAPILSSPFAHSGTFSAALGNGADNRIASISQSFTVPFNQYNLQFYKYIQSVEACGPRYDYVTIFINGVEFTSYNVCTGLANSNWTKDIYNLVLYRGQSVVLRLEFRSDSNAASFYYVDDFSFIP